jgi:hypothetical protein
MAKKFKMPKAMKARWLKALRSGRYKQADGTLFDRIGSSRKPAYCCLGVLARCEKRLDMKTGCFITDDGEEGCTELLTTPGDFNLARFQMLPKRIQVKLSEMNDDGQSFTEIADWIEENL